MNISATISRKFGFLLALVLFAAVPFRAEAQLEMPTSSVTFPTSSVEEPFSDPESQPSPEGTPAPMFSAEAAYPYPSPRFDAEATRLLYLSAALILVTGILMSTGTAGRLLAPLVPRRSGKRP